MGPSSHSPNGHSPTQFLAHICCGQMAAWINMPLGILSVLSVTFVHCGQTVGRIKMKIGMHVGLDIVLDGTQLPLPKRTQSHPIFGPYLLRPNGFMDQDATWYEARPQPRRLCVRWRPRSTLPKKGAEPRSPIFGPFLLWPNGWMHQDATSYGGRPQPRGLCVRWGPSPVNFRPMFIIVIVISLEHCTMHIVIGLFKFKFY